MVRVGSKYQVDVLPMIGEDSVSRDDSVLEDFRVEFDGNITFINNDCLSVLKQMCDKSVALVIIDPPYGAQTHGQHSWDVAWSKSDWINILKEVYRVLIPGGHTIVFSSGKSTIKINTAYIEAHKTLFSKEPSYYPMVWVHNSRDSGRVHSHTPRSQFESMHVYFREGEGKLMADAGTFSKSYAFDEHVNRHNVFQIYKDDCRSKPQPTVQKYFAQKKAQGKHCVTFDFKPEALIRALIRDYSEPGQLVVDICARHGITAVAAKFESRKCIAIEIDNSSHMLAKSRFEDLFGTTDNKQNTTTIENYTLPTFSDVMTVSGLPHSSCLCRSVKKQKRLCSTPGCKLPEYHIGLCSGVTGKRRRI